MPKRARILIVDDERSIRELLEIFLKKEGFAVTSASSAEEGLLQVRAGDFDLVISDIKMADMSGIDLLREARLSNFNGQFILLTAFASARARSCVAYRLRMFVSQPDIAACESWFPTFASLRSAHRIVWILMSFI